MARQQYVRVQERGQVTLPAASRRRLGIEKGDLVIIVETPDGVLIKPQVSKVDELAERIAAEIREYGMPLEEFEEMLERSRNARPALMKELYGIELGDQ